MPSTNTLFLSANTRRTRPVTRCLGVPASSPVMTSTMSFSRMCMSHHLGGQADDPQEAAVAQFAGHGSKNARAAGVLLVVDQHQGVAVEAHIAAVVPPSRFLGADDDTLDYVSRLHLAARNRLLYAGHDHITDAGITATTAAQHLDTHAFFGAGI